MIRKLVLLGLVLTLCAVLITPAAADEDNRGNHEAIWKAPPHGSLESGSDWGPMVSAQANEMNGVSEGVHEAKDQPVPGQNT